MKNIKGVFLLLLFFCFLTGCGKETVRVALKKLGYTRKKQTKYREQDEKKVNVYLKKLSEVGSDSEIIYIDETGFDEYYYREYSWSKRGNVY